MRSKILNSIHGKSRKLALLAVLCSTVVSVAILSNMNHAGYRRQGVPADQHALFVIPAVRDVYAGIKNRHKDEGKDHTNVVSNNLANLTKLAEKEILLFNRVPKVGSTTMLSIIQHLAKQNKFSMRGLDKPFKRVRFSPDEENKLCLHAASQEPPTAIAAHVWYLNFTRYNLPSPIYINMVRDPVERAISQYYYIVQQVKSASPSQVENGFNNLPEFYRGLENLTDFNQCVLSGDPRCHYLSDYSNRPGGDYECMSCFFCGMDDDCASFNSPHVVQKAKDIVERNYAVVGVLEHLYTTLAVMEAYKPRFYAGAAHMYNKIMNGKQVNKTGGKQPVLESVKEMMRKNFTHEIEFYQFCIQRLYQQHQARNDT